MWVAAGPSDRRPDATGWAVPAVHAGRLDVAGAVCRVGSVSIRQTAHRGYETTLRAGETAVTTPPSTARGATGRWDRVAPTIIKLDGAHRPLDKGHVGVHRRCRLGCQLRLAGAGT